MFPFNNSIVSVLDQTYDLDAQSPVLDDNILDMERKLPSREATEDTLTKSYVAFILYCNPHFPLTVDTSQLEDKFNSVPRSDNKEFKTWRLFELIRKLDRKEIDTWGRLALDLGVEPPDTSKQQSIQKVQQYTVRLKRWMRAMHIDAYFEWLLGKEMDYVVNIPPFSDPYPREGRDGVIAEEDLAIRALEPAFRPKRGRRRNSENEELERPQLEETPATAHPSSSYRYHPPWGGVASLVPPLGGDSAAPRSAVQPSAPHLRWQESDTLQTPMSALPGSQREDPYLGEPMSAITPSRKRRRHGPAVSSAWPSAIAEGAKPRGRPPASRVTQDGPYGTFPVQRSVEELRAASPYAGQSDAVAMPPPVAQMTGRPERLSLTVPQRTGNPVRLATPPRLMVSNDSRGTSEVEGTELPHLSFETMKRTLVSDLLRGELTGRPQRLTLEEAKQLADAMLTRANVPRMEDGNPGTQVLRLTAASWLGLGDQLNIPFGPAAGLQKKLSVTRFRLDADGYDVMIPCAEETHERVKTVFDVRWQATQGACQGAFQLTGITFNTENKLLSDVDNIHDLIINRVMSATKEVGMTNDADYLPARAHQSWDRYGHSVREATGTDKADDQINWREKYRMLEFGSSLAHGEFDRYKANMLQKVLDIFLQ